MERLSRQPSPKDLYENEEFRISFGNPTNFHSLKDFQKKTLLNKKSEKK